MAPPPCLGSRRSLEGDTGLFCTSTIDQAFAEEKNKRNNKTKKKSPSVSHLQRVDETDGSMRLKASPRPAL